MGLFELFMVAIGLSMDAFAVSLAKGVNMKKLNYRQVVIIALFFGGFQAAMPFWGWMLGKQFEQYITGFDHWAAFVLLVFIGGKMLMAAGKEDRQYGIFEGQLDIKELLALAVATSIDALAVGITFAFLQVSILPSIALIGCTTFTLSAAGVVLGNRVGIRYRDRAEIAGGSVLILIGTKILLSHLGIL